MISQGEAIAAMCSHLDDKGFTIEDSGTGRSSNIVAFKDRERFLLEVRGNANPSGKPFDASQISQHVAQKLYAALKLVDEKLVGDSVGLVFPADHLLYLEPIRSSLKRLGIRVFVIHSPTVTEPFGDEE